MRSLLHRLLAFHPAWLTLAFVLASVPVLAFLAVAVPAGEVPDEPAHILRADSVRHGAATGFRRMRLDDQGDPAADTAIRADIGLLAAALVFTPGTPLDGKHMSQARVAEVLRLPWANRLSELSFPNTGVYPPLFYLPAAAGMQVAKWLRQGPYVAILSARLVNAALYAALGATALHLARRGRAALFTVLCLPMSLSLAASVNHDGLVIACAGLAGALLTRTGRAAWWSGAALLGAAAMAKPYLLPLALVVPATVPGGLRRNLGRAASGLAAAALPALAWGAAMAWFVAAPFVRGPAQPAGPLYAGPPGTLFPTTSPGEQARILLAHPARLLTLPLRSAWDKGEWLWREGVGVLGTLDVKLPFGLYAAWGWALGAAVLAAILAPRAEPEKGRPAAAAATSAMAGAAASAWCVFILQYLSWTRVGDALVEGVQGRYFLPVAALALPVAALPALRVPAAAALRSVLALPAAALALAGLVVMPLVILNAYYLR